MVKPLRIGIVGARGIGKHHGKWFSRAGCEVTAVYGTTPESAERAAAALAREFSFHGRAYSDWSRFRREGGFEAASICSPAECHWENVRDLAADGRHLLCEKPLVWSWDSGPQQILRGAELLVQAAERAGIILGMNAQYPAALEGWEALHRRVLGREPEHRSLSFVMETRGAPRSGHGPAEVWVDLGPHPLAILDALAPGEVDWSTLQHEDGRLETVVRFDWVAGGIRRGVHLECRRHSGTALRREIGNQDLVAEYRGCTRDGEFAAELAARGESWIGKDFMQVSVERFVEAVRSGDPARVLVGGRAALRQQAALTGIGSRLWWIGDPAGERERAGRWKSAS